MARYVVFPTYNNEILAKAFRDRAVELGYKLKNIYYQSITLDTGDGGIKYSTCEMPFKDHVLGDVKLFFTTDTYRYKEEYSEFKIDGRTAKVYKDKVVVGCTTVEQGDIDKIIAAQKELNNGN